jgi:hypothetical protein
MSTLTIVLIAIVVLAVALAAFMIIRKERSKKLKGRFGPEYDRLVSTSGSQKLAEDEMAKRQKRIEKLPLRELDRREMDRFSASWKAVQAQFVDAPREAVALADSLVRDVMAARGYPMADFEQRAADISVDHPNVISNYRTAHDIAVRDAAGTTNTEDLRQAMVHYRALFEDLLGQTVGHPQERPLEVVR